MTRFRPLPAIGAAFVTFQAWAYARWLIADIPLSRGTVPMPAELAKAVEGAESALCGGAIAWLAVLVILAARERRVGFPLLLTFAWTSAYWQESLVNARVHAFSYNAHFLHRGDWLPYLPLFGTHRPLLDQPLLMEAPVFFWMIPAVGLLAYGLLRWVSRWIRSPALLILVGAASVMAFETAFELSGIAQQLLAWNHVPRTLSLWTGTARQWPLPELLLGVVWSLPALAWFFRDRAALRWLDPAHRPASAGSTTTCLLGWSALVNLAFLAYNLVLMSMTFDTGAEFPAWLSPQEL